MIVSSKGVLIYLGHEGKKYEIIGGSNGELNLRPIP
jgi:hypothetical protein